MPLRFFFLFTQLADKKIRARSQQPPSLWTMFGISLGLKNAFTAQNVHEFVCVNVHTQHTHICKYRLRGRPMALQGQPGGWAYGTDRKAKNPAKQEILLWLRCFGCSFTSHAFIIVWPSLLFILLLVFNIFFSLSPHLCRLVCRSREIPWEAHTSEN